MQQMRRAIVRRLPRIEPQLWRLQLSLASALATSTRRRCHDAVHIGACKHGAPLKRPKSSFSAPVSTSCCVHAGTWISQALPFPPQATSTFTALPLSATRRPLPAAPHGNRAGECDRFRPSASALGLESTSVSRTSRSPPPLLPRRPAPPPHRDCYPQTEHRVE